MVRKTPDAKPEERFRRVLADIGLGDNADGLVRAVRRARRASRNLTPADVLEPHIETLSFSSNLEARRLFDAVNGFWEAIDPAEPRPRATTARERAEDYLEEALRQAGAGDELENVERLLRRSLTEDDGWWEPHLELADLLHHGLGKEDEARNHYSLALECARKERPAAPDPETHPHQWSWKQVAARPYLRALESLADYHVEKAEWEKARRLYERLLRHDPDDPLRLRSRLAEAHERSGDTNGALSLYRDLAKESGAGEPAVLFALGRLLIESGETEEGEILLWRASLVQPWAAAMLLDLPLEGELDTDALPEVEWIEIGLGYAERSADLWPKRCAATTSLRRIFADPSHRTDRVEAIRAAAQLMAGPTGKKLEELKNSLHDLVDPERIKTKRAAMPAAKRTTRR